MPCNNLIRAANKAEARANILESTHLDQQCPKGKQPLKMSSMLKTIRPKNQRPQLRRPAPTLRRTANQKPPEELGEKGNKCVEESKGTERLAPPRVRKISSRPMPPRPTLTRPKSLKRSPEGSHKDEILERSQQEGCF